VIKKARLDGLKLKGLKVNMMLIGYLSQALYVWRWRRLLRITW